MSSRKWTVVFVLSLALNALYAGGQAKPDGELGQMRQEMEQLKQEYEQQRLAYEQRLAKLEEQLKRMETSSPEPGAVSVATVSAPKSSSKPVNQARPNSAVQESPLPAEQAGQNQNPFAQTTDSIQLALTEQENNRVRERAERVLREYVDIGGYFRAGYGRDNEGGPQVGFQAPGALAKGRLGNEAENYGELIVGKNFYLPGAFSLNRSPRANGTSSEPIARVQVRLSMYNPYTNYLVSNATQFGLAEAWAAVGNLSASQPSMNVWAGNRFYRRHDININDFFMYNM